MIGSQVQAAAGSDGALLDLAFTSGPFAGRSFSAVFNEVLEGASAVEVQRFLHYCALRATAPLAGLPPPAAGQAALHGLPGSTQGAEMPARGEKRKRTSSGGGLVANSSDTWPPELMHKYYIFADGSCPKNVTATDNPAGFGAVIYVNTKKLTKAAATMSWAALKSALGPPQSKLSGPVQTNAGHSDFIGALHGTNNTAELTAIAETLLWLLDQLVMGSPPVSACIVVDSQVAKRLVTGEYKPTLPAGTANEELIRFARFVLEGIHEAGSIVDFHEVKREENQEADKVAKAAAEEAKRRGMRADVPSRRTSRVYEEFRMTLGG
mmetsp:Transcript_58914/g.140614  ORF Transcript_58914/g.140614 Transcript_58914/m.140614 type:complete len:323 (-) Transcript_58914:198-1166(-)|eukprot:CAMPEP_0178382668 /NCGR_PEP_ID=MMETSP0689_2-20121128/6609_1 /TAXON_ID=160604 /ORGANISM="Amphidinium massartii, Strain CS-259" /LENGTH=322 /DNA_ID=CAMNT_0020002873 /DNA_START=123 /DNA_END=1091 /DNA_ORIENTATION=+